MVKRAGVALLLVILWAALLVAGTLYGWWRRPLAPPDDPRAFMRAAIPMVNAGNRANTGLILIEKGAVAAEYYSTSADAIDRNTVFATASLSKWITAHAVMKLVEQGKHGCHAPALQGLSSVPCQLPGPLCRRDHHRCCVLLLSCQRYANPGPIMRAALAAPAQIP